MTSAFDRDTADPEEDAMTDEFTHTPEDPPPGPADVYDVDDEDAAPDDADETPAAEDEPDEDEPADEPEPEAEGA